MRLSPNDLLSTVSPKEQNSHMLLRVIPEEVQSHTVTVAFFVIKEGELTLLEIKLLSSVQMRLWYHSKIFTKYLDLNSRTEYIMLVMLEHVRLTIITCCVVLWTWKKTMFVCNPI